MHKQNLGYYISIIYRHMQIFLSKEFDKYGFGSGQYMFFIHIANNEGITQKMLSIDLAIDKGTTAKAINRLIELGYIKNKIVSTDKRSYKLFLTNSGKRILPGVKTSLKKASDVMKGDMNVSDSSFVLAALKKISTNMIENR